MASEFTTTPEIKSEDDAFAVLSDLLAGASFAPDVQLKLTGWPVIEISLQGKGWDSTLSPKVMEALLDLQKEIYRSQAILRYNSTNTGKLTNEEKEALEIRVKVEKGSTVAKIDLSPQLLEIAQKAVEKMPPEFIAGTAIALGMLWAGTAVVKHIVTSRKEVRLQEIQAESHKLPLEHLAAMSKEETKRVEMLADVIKKQPRLEEVARHMQLAHESVIRSLGQAEAGKYNGVEISGDAARELSKNARNKSEEDDLSGLYGIVNNNTSNPMMFKVTVQNQESHEQFTATVDSKAFAVDGELKEKLKTAEWDRETIYLHIKGVRRAGKVVEAAITGASIPA